MLLCGQLSVYQDLADVQTVPALTNDLSQFGVKFLDRKAGQIFFVPTARAQYRLRRVDDPPKHDHQIVCVNCGRYSAQGWLVVVQLASENPVELR